MAQLEVQIGADIRELQTKLPKALKLLDRLKTEQKDLKKAFESGQISSEKYYNKLATNANRLQKVSKATRDLKGNLSGASKGVKNFGKSTANAVPATQEFSRIIQDAPFGIQGVANNITQLTDQFGNLTRKTGSSGAALKAMLGTLSGPAGILLAVSAVTSLLVSYGDKLTFSTKATNGLAKATAGFVGDAKTEIITLTQLLKIAKDESETKVVRQGAIDEINKKYSKYLGNLDLETVKTNKVANSVNNLTQALILKAKVDGLQALITEKTADSSEDIVDAERDRAAALKTLNSEVNKAIKSNFELNRAIGDVKGDRERLKALVALTQKQGTLGDVARQSSVGVGRALYVYKEASNEVKSLNTNLDESLFPLIKLQEQFKKGLFVQEAGVKNIDDGAVIIKSTKKKEDKITKLTKEQIEKRRVFLLELAQDSNNEIFDISQKTFADIDKIYEASGAKLNDELKLSGELSLGNEVFRNILKVEDKIKEVQKLLSSLGIDNINLEGLNLEKLDNFEAKLKASVEVVSAFSGAVGASFSALSTQIAGSLQTGNAVVDAFTQSLINSFAQIAAAGLQSLVTEKVIGIGKNAINRSVSNANAITVATSAAAALGPAGVFALPGLIASQTALVNGAFAGLASFAKGGFSGDDNLAFLNKNELVLRPFEQAALLNVLRGTGMSGVSNNVTSVSNEGGIIGETVLRGTNQVIQYRRAERKMRRRGSV